MGSGKQLDQIAVNQSVVEFGSQKRSGIATMDNTKDDKRMLELSLVEVREDNSIIKGKIEEINGNHEELSKVYIVLFLSNMVQMQQ